MLTVPNLNNNFQKMCLHLAGLLVNLRKAQSLLPRTRCSFKKGLPVSPRIEEQQKGISHTMRMKGSLHNWSVNSSYQTRLGISKCRLLFQEVPWRRNEREWTVARGRGVLKEFSTLGVLSRFVGWGEELAQEWWKMEGRVGQIVEAESQRFRRNENENVRKDKFWIGWGGSSLPLR